LYWLITDLIYCLSKKRTPDTTTKTPCVHWATKDYCDRLCGCTRRKACRPKRGQHNGCENAGLAARSDKCKGKGTRANGGKRQFDDWRWEWMGGVARTFWAAASRNVELNDRLRKKPAMAGAHVRTYGGLILAYSPVAQLLATWTHPSHCTR
jgi:hypothetical protein